MITRQQLASVIDHTLLKAEATERQIRTLAAEAAAYGFATVCINPRWVKLAAGELRRLQHEGRGPRPAAVAAKSQSPKSVGLCACVGFPLGATTSKIKSLEAAQCVRDGATEIDMVASLGLLLSGELAAVRRDIRAVVLASRRENPSVKIKVILETALLNPRQIAAGCRAAFDAGAHFVKTSTGFHPAGGASIESVTLLKKHSRGLKVKAAGGIRDINTAMAMLAAGADRLGCSASIAIVEACER